MRVLGIFAAVGLMAGIGGCTHRSLTRNTVLATSTVMDVQYTSVLNNVAMMAGQPEALPNHVHLADGVVQINDRVGIGQAGGFSTFGGGPFGFEQLGPSGQRQISEQWGTDATTDPERLYDLQCLYRVALGLPPLPPPSGIAYIRRNDSPQDSPDRDAGVEPVAFLQPSTGGGSSGTSGTSSGDSGDKRRVPIRVLLSDVPPPGWYQIGCKKDVPKDACYVGHWGDRYAWVTADGVPGLAGFTLTVLTVIKLNPGEGGGSKSGLAVTGSN